jgi:hypothetical protein
VDHERKTANQGVEKAPHTDQEGTPREENAEPRDADVIEAEEEGESLTQIVALI